jgi:hypothetical protein
MAERTGCPVLSSLWSYVLKQCLLPSLLRECCIQAKMLLNIAELLDSEQIRGMESVGISDGLCPTLTKCTVKGLKVCKPL